MGFLNLKQTTPPDWVVRARQKGLEIAEEAINPEDAAEILAALDGCERLSDKVRLKITNLANKAGREPVILARYQPGRVDQTSNDELARELGITRNQLMKLYRKYSGK